MPKQMSGAERRQWVDRLLEQYASLMWTAVAERYISDTEREDAFIYVFTLAISRLDQRTASLVSEEWMLSLAKEAFDAERPEFPRDETETEQLVEDDDQAVDESPEELVSSSVPSFLVRRTDQMMRANVAMQEAMRHHKGPFWVTLGSVVLTILGIAAIGYGVSDFVYARVHRPEVHQSPSSASGSDLARLAGGLPVTPVATYLQTGNSVDLSHVSVGGNSVWTSSLVQVSDKPALIQTEQTSFSTGDKSIPDSSAHGYTLQLTFPANQVGVKSHAQAEWTIDHWRVENMGNWLVAVVSWTNGAVNTGDTIQIYGFNMTSGQSALMDTLSPEANVANRFVVAAGNQEIAIQSALDDGSGAPPLGLPIQIYKLRGADPHHAMVQTTEIPASFGLMESPVMTSSGLVFEGIAGKPEEETANATTWYQLSTAGTLTRLYGPPIDAQAHWAVEGASGTLWWAETTPDPVDKQREYQVSMEPLSLNKPTSVVKNLNSSVEDFTVDGSYMLWTKHVDSNHEQLVVAQVD